MSDLFLNGTIGDEIAADDVVAVLEHLAKKGEQNIRISLNSAGGVPSEALRIHDAIAAYPGKVEIAVDGVAGGVAMVLLAAASNVTMMPGAWLVVYEPTFFAMGIAEQVLCDAMSFQAAVARVREIMHTRWPDRMRISHGEHWMDQAQSVSRRFASAILHDKGWPPAKPARFPYSALLTKTPPSVLARATDDVATVGAWIRRA